MANLEIGQSVQANRMATDSFYKMVRGTVTGFRNGYVEINATEVMDKWSKQWERHPSSCSCSAKVENVQPI